MLKLYDEIHEFAKISEQIEEDDRELELKVRNAREDYGEFSKEYLRAKHERDKWLIRNKEQQYMYPSSL